MIVNSDIILSDHCSTRFAGCAIIPAPAQCRATSINGTETGIRSVRVRADPEHAR